LSEKLIEICDACGEEKETHEHFTENGSRFEICKMCCDKINNKNTI